MQRVEAHAINQFRGLFDIPDRKICVLAGLERADVSRQPERLCGMTSDTGDL